MKYRKTFTEAVKEVIAKGEKPIEKPVEKPVEAQPVE